MSLDENASYDELLARRDAPPGSTWGIFGPDDDVGMVNLLTPDRVRDGIGCVRRGAMFNLDLPLALDPPVSPSGRQPPRHTIVHTRPNHRDDHLDGFYLQGSSQIDGLRHIRHPEYGFYGGRRDDEVEVGSAALGVGRWAEHGIAGRGVLLDVERHLADEGAPIDHRAGGSFGVDVLDSAAEAQGVELRPADIVLVRTGWLRFVLQDLTHEERLVLPQDVRSAGLAQSEATLRWLWDHRVPLIAADNLSVESYPPAADPPFFTEDEVADGPKPWHEGRQLLHRRMVPLLGVALGELWDLEALAGDCRADGVWEFLLVAKPLNLTGGVGTPANATAIK